MICSLNEIGATLRKAAIGSQVPVGPADDLAAAGVWLSARGLDGVGAVLAALDRGYEPGFDHHAAGAVLIVPNAAIGRCGPSVFELLAAEAFDRAVVEGADAPLLLVGLAGFVSAATGTAFELRFGGDDPIVVTGSGIESGWTPPPTGPSPVEITVVADRADPRPGSSPPRGVAVEEQRWATALDLAARTYVPATTASRLRGAGAGLTDND